MGLPLMGRCNSMDTREVSAPTSMLPELRCVNNEEQVRGLKTLGTPSLLYSIPIKSQIPKQIAQIILNNLSLSLERLMIRTLRGPLAQADNPHHWVLIKL